MGRLFGTDGARGVANRELTAELAMEIGRATALVLTKATHRRPKILIGKDTRISCDMLETALAAGLCSVGADAVLLGVVPTPAVAYLVKKYNADAGVMISASHNSFEYNGIKLFNGEGYKLPDAMEEEIEAVVLDKTQEIIQPVNEGIGRVSFCDTAISDYIDYIKSTIDEKINIKVAIDCANGSSSTTAERLFTELGAQVIMINNKPSGININDRCGSTHLESLIETVVREHCDCGVAFDGDADRCLAVDEKGEIIDGDKMLALFSYDMKNNGRLKNNTLVVTVMSNLGLFRFCEKSGIDTRITKVGDRYVLEEMKKDDYIIGGEQSGHIIFLEHATTGDGQLSAAKLLSIFSKSSSKASENAHIMKTYPQILKNIRVTPEGKNALDGCKEVWQEIEKWEQAMGENGRVLVRCSGTEPLIRVMVECLDKQMMNNAADEISKVITERLA